MRKCAADYEKTFRAHNLNVPQNLRDIKAKLDLYNGINGLLPAELDQYKNYLEEIANDYDNAANPAKNLLVLQPKEFESLIKKYEDPQRFGLVKLDRDLVYRIQAGGKNKGKEYKKKYWERKAAEPQQHTYQYDHQCSLQQARDRQHHEDPSESASKGLQYYLG